jgi:beta-N-acetylhexosaminidase
VEDETVVEETVPPVPQELPPEEPPAVEELPSVPVPLAQLVIPPLPEGEEAFIEELLNARNVPALPGPEEVVVPFVGRPGPPRALSERQRRELTIRRIIAAMTPEELIGQLFMPSLPLAPAGGGSVDYNRRVAALIDEVQPGGVILFAHNLRTPEQVRTLVEDLQRHSTIPLLISVDQEGGLVSRLTSNPTMGATVIPSAQVVGRTGDTELAYKVARVIARELRALGITMNFAPVADILTNPQNRVIGNRAYSSDPAVVARMVSATVRGMQDEGVSAVIKHFPGHGDTREDTHYQAAVVPHSLERLREIEFLPFRAGIAANTDGVMTAHVTVPAVGGVALPATLSPAVIDDLLRQELGFSRLVVTDSLVMAAVTEYFPEDLIPLRAFQAGADVLLQPRNAAAARRVMLRALEDGTITRGQLERSVRRILHVKFDRGLMLEDSRGEDLFLLPSYFTPPEGSYAYGIPEHRELMERVRQQ